MIAEGHIMAIRRAGFGDFVRRQELIHVTSAIDLHPCRGQLIERTFCQRGKQHQPAVAGDAVHFFQCAWQRVTPLHRQIAEADVDRVVGKRQTFDVARHVFISRIQLTGAI